MKKIIMIFVFVLQVVTLCAMNPDNLDPVQNNKYGPNQFAGAAHNNNNNNNSRNADDNNAQHVRYAVQLLSNIPDPLYEIIGEYMDFRLHFKSMGNWNGIACSPKHVVFGLPDGTIESRDPQTGKIQFVLDRTKTKTTCDLDANPNFIAAVKAQKDIDILSMNKQNISSLKLNPYSMQLRSCCGNGEVVDFWDMETGNRVCFVSDSKVFEWMDNNFRYGSGTLIESAANDGIKYQDPKPGVYIRGLIRAVSFDGSIVAQMRRNRPELFFLDIEKKDKSGKEENVKKVRFELECSFSENVPYLTGYSFDNKFFAVGSTSGVISVFDLETDKKKCELKWNPSSVMSMAFSADGKKLVSGFADGTVCVSDIQSGELLHTLKGHEAPVSSVAFTGADGQGVISADGLTARRWQLVSPGKFFVDFIRRNVLDAQEEKETKEEKELWEIALSGAYEAPCQAIEANTELNNLERQFDGMFKLFEELANCK